ncbi:MAG: TetR/AcrR family transcriptional regulator [Ilumatobacter sp.]
MATQEERRSSTRKAIVDAAIEAFERHGSPDVPLEQIAQAAGVTKSTIHYHFSNRAGLLGTVAIRLFREIEERINDVHAGGSLAAPDYVRALLAEQSAPVGRVLFTTGDELLRMGKSADVDPYRYLRHRLEQLGVGGSAAVKAAAIVEFGRQLAFGLMAPTDIGSLLHELDL